MNEVTNGEILKKIILKRFKNLEECSIKLGYHSNQITQRISENKLSYTLCKDVGNILGLDLMWLSNSKARYSKNEIKMKENLKGFKN